MLSSESVERSRAGLFVEESPEWEELNAKGKEQSAKKIIEHDWATGLLYAVCDIVCWIVVYGLISHIRRDAFFSSAFEFVLVDVIALAVLLQALYIIGGYN